MISVLRTMLALALATAAHARASKRPAVANLSPADFEVTTLPGFAPGVASLGFKLYAGYMPAANGTELYFVFATSKSKPATDPVALWLNGGPGASSVEYGFWTEHGPFRLTGNGTTMELYDYSWNQQTSMLYIEAPRGVGFSWSSDPAKYASNTDSSASLDNYETLLNFFDVFTDFATQPFWLTGESYGGHYIPTLAKRVLDGKAAGDGEALFGRTKGFLIGNPGINSDWYFNVNEYAFQTYLWSHALLPHDAYQASVTACGWDKFFTDCDTDFTHPSTACKLANTNAYRFVPKVWDPYSVLAPTCHDATGEVDRKVATYPKFLGDVRTKYNISTTYAPCMKNLPPVYMNQPEVIKAFHADVHKDPARAWPNHPKNWNYGEELDDIAKLFPQFFEEAPDWRILVVSGDADAAVPFVGTERWMKCLGRKVKKQWGNWMVNGDVAGSILQYEGITFQSVKGCGHTIPSYCPELGYQFWADWLAGKY